MQLEIRVLDASDADKFHQLRLLGLQESPKAFGQTPEEFAAMKNSDELVRWIAPSDLSVTLGAFVDSVLVGVAGVRREGRSRMRHKGIVWGVYLDPAQRGKGIAKKLIQNLIEVSKEKLSGLKQLLLTVSVTQPVAKALYTSLNFKSFGIEPRALCVDGEYVDEEHMWLDLQRDN